jgi:hypothetical protein
MRPQHDAVGQGVSAGHAIPVFGGYHVTSTARNQGSTGGGGGGDSACGSDEEFATVNVHL